jgi:hypothetical protein
MKGGLSENPHADNTDALTLHCGAQAKNLR